MIGAPRFYTRLGSDCAALNVARDRCPLKLFRMVSARRAIFDGIRFRDALCERNTLKR